MMIKNNHENHRIHWIACNISRNHFEEKGSIEPSSWSSATFNLYSSNLKLFAIKNKNKNKSSVENQLVESRQKRRIHTHTHDMYAQT